MKRIMNYLTTPFDILGWKHTIFWGIFFGFVIGSGVVTLVFAFLGK